MRFPGNVALESVVSTDMKTWKNQFMVVLLLALALATGCTDEALEPVQLASGLVSGVPADETGAVIVYRGIPYAAPPVGELRWQPPQPVQPWAGMPVCENFGPACPQPHKRIGIYEADRAPADEDCLYLNIWAPAGNPTAKLPVMVWIHGGGFTIGSGSMRYYSGQNLARLGAVIVTINYRLGPLGFFAHPQLSAESERGVSGNYGLLDQIAALQWVQQNIAAFGGDPDCVTIFGESAGSVSVCCLMVSPPAAGLFHRAIAQSGAAQLINRRLREAGGRGETGEAMGVRLAQELGCDGPDAIAKLRSKSPQELLDTIKPQLMSSSRGNKLYPMVDGYVLPDEPGKLFAEGKQHNVPLIMGSNAADGNIFALNMPLKSVTAYKLLVRMMFRDRAEEVLKLFPAESDDEVKAAYERLLTVSAFACPARLTIRQMSKVAANGYLYHFTRVPPLLADRGMGAIHGLEVPYVFENVRNEMAGPDDEELSRTISAAWVRFAATGDPSGDGLEWPPYDAETDLHFEFGDELRVGSGLYREECDLLEAVRAEMGRQRF